MKKLILHIFGIMFLIVSIWFYFINKPTCTLDDLNKKIKFTKNKIKNIQWGGCGIFALYLTDYLDQHKLSYKIIYIRRSWNKSKIPNHVLICLQSGTYIDANGFNGYGYPIIFGLHSSIHTKKELKQLINENGWNSKFNRNDTILIKNLICN